MGLKVLSAKIVDLCSKHRGSENVPVNIHGEPWNDKDIACFVCMTRLKE